MEVSPKLLSRLLITVPYHILDRFIDLMLQLWYPQTVDGRNYSKDRHRDVRSVQHLPSFAPANDEQLITMPQIPANSMPIHHYPPSKDSPSQQ